MKVMTAGELIVFLQTQQQDLLVGSLLYFQRAAKETQQPNLAHPG